MNADKLLDAFGLIDDRFVIPEPASRGVSWRRRFAILAAALLIAAMCLGTAMAVSEGFRDLVFSIFRINTHDAPPATEEVHPTEPGLHAMDIVNIDGQVNAWYFSSGGFVQVCDGGFYTSQWPGDAAAPDDPAFWEITFDGIRELPSTRIDIPFSHGGKTFRIRFDYAVLNGKLAIQAWPEGLNENPFGNGWNLVPHGDRTDTALLTVPVRCDQDYTQDLFLLDLTTLETTELIVDTARHGVIAYGYRITDDLRYAIVMGIDRQTGGYGYWLYDVQADSMNAIDTLTRRNTADAYFLNDSTMVIQETLENGCCNMVRFHIPSGVQSLLLENVSSNYRPIRHHWAGGRHGLLFRDDGGIDLIDFQTGNILKLEGLDGENLVCDESPDGSRIMLGYESENGFTSLGILDPGTGVLTMLDREVSGGSESFRGWLDNDTLVITAHDIPNADMEFTPGDGYYVYIYHFSEE